MRVEKKCIVIEQIALQWKKMHSYRTNSFTILDQLVCIWLAYLCFAVIFSTVASDKLTWIGWSSTLHTYKTIVNNGVVTLYHFLGRAETLHGFAWFFNAFFCMILKFMDAFNRHFRRGQAFIEKVGGVAVWSMCGLARLAGRKWRHNAQSQCLHARKSDLLERIQDFLPRNGKYEPNFPKVHCITFIFLIIVPIV